MRPSAPARPPRRRAPKSRTITALIFIAAYAAIAAGRVPYLKIDRTGVAVVAAILMVVTGAIGFDAAVRAVDFRTIVLLFSMMVIVANLRLAGGLAALAQVAGERFSPLPHF